MPSPSPSPSSSSSSSSHPPIDPSETLLLSAHLDLLPDSCSLDHRRRRRSDLFPSQDSSPVLLREPHSTCADSEEDNSSSSSNHSIITREEAGIHEEKTDQIDLDSTDSLATGWTDDKHRSYLTFMEENFVKDMYEREYCAVDVCGHEACHQGANTVTHSQQKNVHEFKSWRNGDWQRRRSMPRHLMPWALFQNPWINHFRHPAASHIVSADSATASNMRKFSNNTLSLDLQENEEVESQQFKGPPPNAATPIISHHQNASANLISNMIHDACKSMKVDTSNHQDASGSMKVDISNHQDASGSMKVDTSNHQVAFPETQCLTSFITPRKRNFQSDSNQWRISTRQKFCDDGHIPTRDASEV